MTRRAPGTGRRSPTWIGTGTAAAICLVLGGCGRRQAEEPSISPPSDALTPVAVSLSDRAAAAGLDFVHANGMVGEYHMAELIGAGAALFDYDGDGDLDAYLVQGSVLEPPAAAAAGGGDRLYRNDGGSAGSRFVDVSESSGELAGGYGMGVAVGDYDNDGDLDIYRTSYGANRLLRNRGDGTFEDRTVTAGVMDDGWSVPATFFDLDRDGWLDLFVGNYLEYEHGEAVHCFGPSGRRDWCGAIQFPGAADRLFRNRGERGGEVVFEETTASAGLALPADERGRALGAIAADLDGDGWQDLYVGNDAGPNRLWLNRGSRAGSGPLFADGALLAGMAVNAEGRAEASMGIGVGDYDRDADPDLVLGHLVVETNTLYRNRGGGMFEDRSAASELGRPSRTHTAFGMLFLDFDGDGWLDLFAANGAVQNIESLASRGDPLPVHEINQLFRNRGPVNGEVRYREVTGEAGELSEVSEISRGVAGGDVDNDGDTDLLLANNNGPARLLVDEDPPGRWLGLRLVTGEPARDALGAAVVLEPENGPPRWARAATDGSYASAGDPRLLFALGAAEGGAAVRVRWPDGGRSRFHELPPERYSVFVRRGPLPVPEGAR